MRPAAAWGVSRALCWVVGVAAAVVLGAHAGTHDPFHLTAPFGEVGDKLVAPAARWDAMWFLLIADHGYAFPPATQFYPLYPLLARVVGAPFASSLVGGILVSLGGLLVALVLLERLATLELGDRIGRRTMMLLAFFPTAVFFSAVYSEGLFLALSIGAVYAARRDRWAVAGICAGLATLARPTGFLLLVPLLLLYLYGPRGERSERVSDERADRPRWRPAYRPRRDLLWLLLVPIAFGAYAGYVGDKFDDAFVLLRQGAAWHLGFTFPVVTVVRATGTAASGAVQIFHGRAPNNVYEFGFFVVAAIATVGAFRRLPLAYAAYAAVGVIFILCFPVDGKSLSSFSRYMAPLFPILMWLALWTSERRFYGWVLCGFAALMVVNAARFATWHFVA